MAEHRVVFVSKDDKFCVDEKAAGEISSRDGSIRFFHVRGNSRPLADVYNGFLSGPEQPDFTYFVHADVGLDFEGLARHVEDASGRYDVMGLCGCEKLNVSISPLNWFNGSRPWPQHRWGCVSHGELGDQVSFFSAHSPDVRDREVACVDGLCIIFGRKAVESGLRFDPAVGAFDCYDTDVSL